MTHAREEPAWLNGFALELLARSCVVELGVPVRLPVLHRKLTRRRVELRRGGDDVFEVVRVPARADAVVARLLDAPQAAWRGGERRPAQLALQLHDALANSPKVEGDRRFLAVLAVVLFLDMNGWLAGGRAGRGLVLEVRRLAGSTGAAAARALQDLVRPGY